MTRILLCIYSSKYTLLLEFRKNQIEVTIKLLLGTAQFLPGYGALESPAVGKEQALELLDYAWELGVDTLDTALSYGPAHDVIGKSDKPFKIHTKINSNQFDETTLFGIKQELANQNLEVIYLHDAESINHENKIQEISLMLESTNVLLGVSIYSKSEFIKATQNKNINIIQFPINILNQEIDVECRQIAHKEGKKLIGRSIFLQGLLTKNWEEMIFRAPELQPFIENLEVIAIKYNLDLETCAMTWALNQDHLNSVIVGVESTSQLYRNFSIYKNLQNNINLQTEIKNIILPSGHLVDPRGWLERSQVDE